MRQTVSNYNCAAGKALFLKTILASFLYRRSFCRMQSALRYRQRSTLQLQRHRYSRQRSSCTPYLCQPRLGTDVSRTLHTSRAAVAGQATAVGQATVAGLAVKVKVAVEGLPRKVVGYLFECTPRLVGRCCESWRTLRTAACCCPCCSRLSRAAPRSRQV